MNVAFIFPSCVRAGGFFSFAKRLLLRTPSPAPHAGVVPCTTPAGAGPGMWCGCIWVAELLGRRSADSPHCTPAKHLSAACALFLLSYAWRKKRYCSKEPSEAHLHNTFATLSPFSLSLFLSLSSLNNCALVFSSQEQKINRNRGRGCRVRAWPAFLRAGKRGAAQGGEACPCKGVGVC